MTPFQHSIAVMAATVVGLVAAYRIVGPLGAAIGICCAVMAGIGVAAAGSSHALVVAACAQALRL